MLKINSNSKKDKGFTIVELLVVIVVIGILAAITIVSYTGITNKAKAAKAQQNASSIQNVAEIFFADSTSGAYPANAAAIMSYSGTTKVPSGVTVTAAAANKPDASDGENTVYYMPKGTTGGCIFWYDFNASTQKVVYVGNATTGSAATPSCS